MLIIWTNASEAALETCVTAPLAAIGAKWDVVPVSHIPKVAPGDVVLAMGMQALARLQSFKMVPKGRSLKSVRGQRIAGPNTGASFLATYDPGIVHREPDKGPMIKWDAILAHRLHTTGTTVPEHGEYTWVDDLTDLIDHTYHLEPAFIGLDAETENLFPYYADKQIVTTQWAAEPGRAYVIDHFTEHGGALPPVLREQMMYLLHEPKIRVWGANLKYDLGWMFNKWGLTCSNFTFDLLIAASLVDENRVNSLNALTKELVPKLGGYDDVFEATADKSDMATELKKDRDGFLIYSGGDADATLRDGHILRKVLASDYALTRFFTTISMPAVRAFERVEQRGVLIDYARYKALEVEAKAEQKRLTTEAFAEIPHTIKAKHYPKLKLSRAALKIDYLFGPAGLGLTPTVFTEGTKKKPPDQQIPSVSIDDHLSQFAAHPVAGKFVNLLKDLGGVEKVLSNYIGTKNAKGEYVKGFLSHLRPDGRFHPTYMLYAGALFEGKSDKGGTVTGRTSAKNPAVQTLPKHSDWGKKLRKCYIAPEDMACWQIDFSQGELRVAACLANETSMLDAYRAGVDLHAKTAASMMGIPLDEFMSWKKSDDPELKAKYAAGRQKAKAVNFGLLYSMGAKGLVTYAWKSYSVVFSLAEAQETRETFFSTYPRLEPWHDKMRALAHNDKAVRSPLGRIRHLPHVRSTDHEVVARAERQAINSPVQSALSDLCLWALAEIETRFEGRQERFHTVGMTHDSLNGYGHVDTIEVDVAEAAGVVTSLPIRDTFEWDHQIPFPVDAEIGLTMGDLEEFPLTA